MKRFEYYVGCLADDVSHFLMAQAYEKKDRNEFKNAIEEYGIALENEPDGAYAAKSTQKITELTTRRDKLKKFWGK